MLGVYVRFFCVYVSVVYFIRLDVLLGCSFRRRPPCAGCVYALGALVGKQPPEFHGI